MSLFNKHRPAALLIFVALSLYGGCEPEELYEQVRPLVQVEPAIEVVVDDTLLAWDARVQGRIFGERCRITLFSSVDGRVWSGRTDPDGVWYFRGALTPGTHSLTFEARCMNGLASKHVDVDVRDNESPDCRIVSPLEGQVYESGSRIAFVADVWDPDDDEMFVLWRSDLDGGLIEGEEWAMRIFTEGTHQIELTAKDSFGEECSESVSIWIR